MRSCTEGGLRALILLLLCLAAASPPPAAGSAPSSPRVAQYSAPAGWGTDLDEAIGRARAAMRPILVFFTAPDCPACDQIKRFSLDNAALQSVIRKFERAEIDLSRRPELATLFEIEKVPALLVIDPDGRVKGRVAGYATARALKNYLENIVAGHWSAVEIDRLIADLETGKAPAEKWRKALSAMENADVRDRILALSGRLSPEDIRILTACLDEKQLAVRLGALDLLEEVNDAIMGFDPWGDPGSGGQQALLKRWRQWAQSGQGTSAGASVLTREKFDRHIQDLIGGDPQRSRRALQALSRGGRSAAGFILDYFQTHPALDATALRRIKEVQYALVIPASNGLDPNATAHRIVWGNPDVQIRTIRQLADCGIGPSAILVDLLAHDDPLVRETAVEILFKAAGPLAVAPVKAMLEGEKDPDVSFAVLKHLGDINTAESQKILYAHFTHANEDLAITAVESAVKSSLGSMGDRLMPLLEDPRWRVRVAAIEGIRKKGGRESGVFDQLRGKEMQVPDRVAKALCRCLEDPDEFVRHTAAAAIGELKVDGAEGPLKKAYDRYPDMHGIVVSVLMTLGESVPSSAVDALFGPEPDDLLFVLDNIKKLNRSSRQLIRKAAGSDNPDVACSALRIIAGSEKRQGSDNALLIEALSGGKTEKQLTVLQEFDLDSDDARQVREALKSVDSQAKAPRRPSGDTPADVLIAAAGLMEDPSASELVRSSAMRLLYQYGHAGAFKKVLETWPQLTAAMRTAVIRSLPLYGREAIPLFRRALDDDYTDVWQTALNQFYDDEGRQLFAEPLIDYLMDPAGRLTPAMMWPEGLYRLCAENPRSRIPISRKVLSAPDASAADRSILALTVCALADVPEEIRPTVLALTRDASPFVRRAAWAALAAGGEKAFEKHFDAVLADPSGHVRELIPALLTRNGYDKTSLALYFSEEEFFTDYQGLRLDFAKPPDRTYDAVRAFVEERGNTAPPAAVEKIKSMMADDPDPWIRFRCMLCLLSHRIPLDLGQVAATARSTGRPEMVAGLLADFFSTHSYSLGENFKVLLPLLQTPNGRGSQEYLVESFLQRWGGHRAQPPGQARLSFVSDQDPLPSQPMMATFTDGYDEIPNGEDDPIEMVLFTAPGCRRCFAVEKYIRILRFQYPNLRVHRYNVLTRQGLAHNEALSRKFMADPTAYAATPGVFMAGGYLIDRDISIFSLEKLMRYSAANDAAAGLLAVSPEELAAANGFIRDRRNTLSWFGVARTGLLKGLSPPALAALLLVLYYLNAAGRTGLSTVRYAALYAAAAAAVTVLLWLLPQPDIAGGTYLHDIGGVLMWALLLYMVWIGLRFLFRGLRRPKKSVTNAFKKQKEKKIPGRRYVAGVVVLWATVLAVLDLPALGDARTVTLVYSIKNHIALFPSMLMLISCSVMWMLPSAGVLLGLAQFYRKQSFRSWVSGHHRPACMALGAVWIWVAVKYFQIL
jgi:HEAT repeat protein